MGSPDLHSDNEALPMQMNPTERFALQKLFGGQDVTSSDMRRQLDLIEVVARKNTGVGFFTTMMLASPLKDGDQRQWDWNFKHRRLTHGGSFMCWIDDRNTLELEAVTHDGDWPDQFNPDDFAEA